MLRVYRCKVLFDCFPSTANDPVVVDLEVVYDRYLDDGEDGVVNVNSTPGSAIATRAKNLRKCFHVRRVMRRVADLVVLQNIFELLTNLDTIPAAVPAFCGCFQF